MPEDSGIMHWFGIMTIPEGDAPFRECQCRQAAVTDIVSDGAATALSRVAAVAGRRLVSEDAGKLSQNYQFNGANSGT